MTLLSEILLALFTSLGVVLGGSIIGSFGVLLSGGSPFDSMRELANTVRLWAVVVAMGGTFGAIEALESGLYLGQVATLIRQIAVIVTAFFGAQLGHWLIRELTNSV